MAAISGGSSKVLSKAEFNIGDKVYLISPEGVCESGYTVARVEVPDLGRAENYVLLEWVSKLDSGNHLKRMWFSKDRVSHEKVDSNLLKFEKHLDKITALVGVPPHLSIYYIAACVEGSSVLDSENNAIALTYGRSEYKFSCYFDVFKEELKRGLLVDGKYIIKVLNFAQHLDDVTLFIKNKEIISITCVEPKTVLHETTSLEQETTSPEQETDASFARRCFEQGITPGGHSHTFSDPRVEELEEKYAEFGINLRLNNEHIAALRKNISELREKESGPALDYDSLLKRIEVLESKEGLKRSSTKLSKQIEPGMTVWSKATKSGPWIAISPTEVEVGVGGANLNSIQRVMGWIVKGQDNTETVFPAAELTRSSPWVTALNSAAKPSQCYTKLIFVVCSVVISSILYLRFIL